MTDFVVPRAVRLALVLSCMFAAWGVAQPFLPRWLEVTQGLSGLEIGIVLSSAQLARIAIGPPIAAWADGFSDRRTPLRIIAVGALIAWAAFFYVRGFWMLAAIAFVAQALAQALSPLIEGAALRASASDRLPFGAVRAAGSFAYVVSAIAGGALITAVGLTIATPIWVVAALGLMTGIICFWLPHDPAPRVHAGFRKRLRAGLAFARTPKIAFLLFGCACIQGAHGFYYGFSALVWRNQGLSAATVGQLWGFAVSLEILLLIALPRIERVLKPERLILIGAGAGVLRWSLLALAPVGWALWPIQALHGLTFSPAHVGALRVITRECPEEVALFVQSLYAALQAGLFAGLAFIASGWLYDHVGAQGYWLMSALSAAGLLLIWRMNILLAQENARPREASAR
ncbi:MAG: MFS transporter [Hyphomonadaceae bacterium]